MLFAVQVVSLAGPALVVVVQLLTVRSATARLLPRCVSPMSPEQKQTRAENLQSVLVERACLDRILTRFDDNDFQKFNALLANSSASVGMMAPSTKSVHPSMFLRTLLMKNAPASSPDATVGARDKAEGATISV